MNIFLTYDYEIFFGDPTGSVEKCMIEPTNLLRGIASRTGAKMVFFVDVGHLKKLAEYSDKHPSAKKDYFLIINQIKDLVNDGHDCQLHIHPHWEDCKYKDDKWIMKTHRYKLSDFSDDEITRIIPEYKSILYKITGKPVTSYRAGGWCLQPFSRVKDALERSGIKLDSTVFPGGKFTEGNYYYDFTSTPDKGKWKFSNDLCQEDEFGKFIEYPISSLKYSPLFFWRLFTFGRLNPKKHKPIGNGYPMSSPGMRKKMLTKGMLSAASVDGYFVTKMNKIIQNNRKKEFADTVFIGHPKACTFYSLTKLEAFINEHKNKVQFLTFADLDI